MSMRPNNRIHRRRRSVRGFLLVDVIIGMFFLVMTTLSLMSLFPVIKKSEQMSSEESKAIQMCNRLIEHIQMLGSKDINGTNLTALNLIDQGQAGQPYSFTHVPLDEASHYSPAQALRNANGSLTYSTIGGNSVKVIVTLQYTSDTGQTKTIRTGTIVGAFR
jgi:type II secretory pathway pseudopilin PulG